MFKRLLLSICFIATTGILIAHADERKTRPPLMENLPQPKQDKKSGKSRGEMLYENHCTRCHESKVHIRKHLKAANEKQLYNWVIKWSKAEKLGWQTNDIDDVVEFLNNKYYKF